MGSLQKPSRRLFLRWAALVMAAGALEGCGRRAPTPTSKEGSKVSRTTPGASGSKIRLVYGRPTGTEFDLLGKLAKGFTETAEGARYEVEDMAITGDPIARLRTLEAAGTGPDVHIQTDETIPDWARDGLLLALDPFLVADTKFDLSDFYEHSLANARYRGQLWALPWSCAGAYLFINKSLFEATGVALPKPDWSWDDYKVAAAKLTIAEQNQWGAAPITNWWQMAERIWQNGAEVFDAPRTTCLLDSERAMEAMEFWTGLTVADKVAPNASAMGAGGAARLFLNGKLAMYEEGLYALLGLRQAPFKWSLAYLPFRRRKANMLWSGSQVISARTKQANGAWLLLKHITGPDALRTVSATLKVPCARKSVDAKRPYVDPSIDIDWSLVPQGVENGRLLEVTPRNDQVSRLLGRMLSTMMAGTQTVAEVVKDTVPQINALLSAAQGTP